MKREKLLKLLDQYNPIDPDEIKYKTKIVSFVKSNPDCFERSLSKGHITSSCWLINSTKEKALLLHHAKLNIWCQPGGHCDGSSDTLLNAIKEAKEETGIDDIVALQETLFDIDIHPIPSKGDALPHFHYDVRFLLQIASDKSPTLNHESKNFIWVDKDPNSLPTDERSILRMWEKWQKGKTL